MENGFQFDLSAAAWRNSIADERAFVEALATRFEGALPDKTVIERQHGLFVKSPGVECIRISFDSEEYTLHFSGKHGIRTEISKVVRGIRLKTETVPFPDWLDALSQEISRYAEGHDELHAKLLEFLMS